MRVEGPSCPRLSPWHLALKHFVRCPQQPALDTFSLEPFPVLQGGVGLAYQATEACHPAEVGLPCSFTPKLLSWCLASLGKGQSTSLPKWGLFQRWSF